MSHQDAITCIDCHSENTLVLTGSTDVTSKLINTNTGKVNLSPFLPSSSTYLKMLFVQNKLVMNMNNINKNNVRLFNLILYWVLQKNVMINYEITGFHSLLKLRNGT